jgi:FAD/FMN-containing dehydrogenase
MNKRFANMVGTENVSENPLDLEAYGFCCSDIHLKPSTIIWPKNLEQVRRVLLFANQGRTPVVSRGSGTSLTDGCIAENAIVLSSERMNKVLKLDLKNKLIEVEAGIRIYDLNLALRALNVQFPLVPLNPDQTIGGMVSLNCVSKESQSVGRMDAWVEEVEFADGTGKAFNTRKKELVVGREGVSGFITKAKLRIADLPSLSVDIFSSNQLSELLGQARNLKRDKEVFSLEFIDKKTSQELSFEPTYTLFVAYNVLKGKIRTVQDVKAMLDRLDSVHSAIRSQGYYYLEDPTVSLEKSYDLIEWCEKHDVRLHGHIGLGVFYAYFQKKDKDLLETFRSFVKRIDGTLGNVFGFGLKNKDFLTPEKKKEFIKLKDEYDYNNILSPGKILDYR